MKLSMPFRSVALTVLALAAACKDRYEPTNVEEMSALGSPRPAASPVTPGAPSPLVQVAAPGGALELWPFTGTDVAGTPSDPVNLLFHGRVDPRALRAAVLFLDGDRTAIGFPAAFPFNCTWSDAIGGVQTAYATTSGWVGNAIQLQCGTYGPIRFHFRLWGAGDWTIGNVHLEVLIPGTTDHQVLSWELAEQLVTVDLLRTGLLDPAAPLFPTAQINPAPFYREIPAILYNGLPVELRAAIGGPLGDVSGPVGIGTDGHATVFQVGREAPDGRGIARQDFTIDFDQVIPKPFCASGPFDFILVQGPVTLRQIVHVTPSGNFLSQFEAVGHLDIVPVNPLTDPPTVVGEPYRATVNEHHRGIVTDNVTMAAQIQLQVLIPPSGPFRGRLRMNLAVGPGATHHAVFEVDCSP